MTLTSGFISELVGREVTYADGGREVAVGRVSDFVVHEPQQAFPPIDGIVIKTGGKHDLYAPFSTVEEITELGPIRLRAKPELAPFAHEESLYLVSDLFDKQIVDINGRKVVRINDLEFANVNGTLRVVAADIGLAGLLRRLGLKSFAQRFLPKVHENIPRALIAWDAVAPIRDTSPDRVRLTIEKSRLSKLHPSDLAEIISELSAADQARVMKSLDDETAADALEHLDPETQQAILEDLGTERAADIVEEMDADDAADLLHELDEERRQELLAEMEPETAGELRELATYEPDTAAGLMTKDFVWIYPHRTAAATMEKLREISPDTDFIYYLFVTDQSMRLLGVLSLRTLILAAPDATIESIMESDVVAVHPEQDARDVASTIARYDLLAVPVVDDDGIMSGIITVDDAIDVLLPEKVRKQLPRFTARHHRAAPDVEVLP
ncbi:MAG TPA: CBS domain-containing protein [Candidatus Dormibacteraeota bacterium]|nr:CBS domain-containing protein [Candidatus Dormibacteraeota bacterium]